MRVIISPADLFDTDLLPPVIAQETAPAPGAPGEPGTQDAPNPLVQFAPIILMFVIFYFILIRPQQKRQKELRAQQNSLQTGDKVITAGGVHGLVTNTKDTTVILKISDSVKVEFEKSAVQSVIKKSNSPEDSGSDS